MFKMMMLKYYVLQNNNMAEAMLDETNLISTLTNQMLEQLTELFPHLSRNVLTNQCEVVLKKLDPNDILISQAIQECSNALIDYTSDQQEESTNMSSLPISNGNVPYAEAGPSNAQNYQNYPACQNNFTQSHTALPIDCNLVGQNGQNDYRSRQSQNSHTFTPMAGEYKETNIPVADQSLLRVPPYPPYNESIPQGENCFPSAFPFCPPNNPSFSAAALERLPPYPHPPDDGVLKYQYNLQKTPLLSYDNQNEKHYGYRNTIIPQLNNETQGTPLNLSNKCVDLTFNGPDNMDLNCLNFDNSIEDDNPPPHMLPHDPSRGFQDPIVRENFYDGVIADCAEDYFPEQNIAENKGKKTSY